MKIGMYLVTMLKARANPAKTMKHTFKGMLGTREAIHLTFSSRVNVNIF